MQTHTTVSREQWNVAREALLAREKEFTRARDRLSAERRALPWVEIDKSYTFEGPRGRETLGDLFGGRSQLVIQHFMFGPDDTEGCPGCSFCADHVDAAFQHLEHHDISFVAVSLAMLEAYRRRMGWNFKWVSSGGGDFNYDFHVSFAKDELAKGKVLYNYAMIDTSMQDLPGHSVFYKDADGGIFHTYSSYGRGTEELIGAYKYLDLTPNGRNENGPYHAMMDWMKRHDQYEGATGGPDCCHAATDQPQGKPTTPR